MDQHRTRILLVEDDEDDYVLVRDLLAEIRGTSFALDWVTTYEAALEALGRAEHDICLLDYRLGARDGLDLVQAAQQQGCKAPLIVLTGQGDHAVDMAAMQAGAADYLTKGQVDAALLERAMRYAIERTRVQEALRRSEERFAKVFHASPDAIVITGPGGRYLDVNESFLRSSGYRRDEVIGRTSTELHRWVEASEYADIQRMLSAQGSIRNAEVRFRAKTGAIRHALMSLEQIDLYGESCVLSITRDITARKRVEEDLRKLSYAVEQSPTMIMITGATGKVEYVNLKFTAVTGYMSTDVMGQELAAPVLTVPRLDAGAQLWDALTAGGAWRGAWQSRKKTGELYWEFVSISPIRNAAAVITHFLVVKEDLTAAAHMRQRLGQAERLASLGTLSAGLAHELNQPLTAIRVTVDSMLYGKGRGWTISEERLADSLHIISEQCARAAVILDDVRTFARDDDRRRGGNGSFQEGLERVLRMIGTQIKARDITLRRQIPAALPRVALPQLHVEQVLINLLINARQELERVEKRGKTISITAARDTVWVVLRVEDNGPGIAPEFREHLFDPFFTTKEPGEGVGLGLSIVHGMITEAGGEITVVEGSAGGAAFVVRLPVVEE